MNWIARLTRQMIPAPCAICGLPSSSGHGLCPACAAQMRPEDTPVCPVCALPTAAPGVVCPDCLRNPPPYDATLAGKFFEPGVRHLIHALKYRHDTAVLNALCAPLLQRIQTAPVPTDAVLLPMPLHPSRLRTRGFNQAALLADVLARHTGLRVMPQLVRRVRADAAQVTQGASARRRALQAAFQAAPRVPERVIVVDDVMTTGSTVAAVATTLKAAGAVWVGGWVVARTLNPSNTD
ncbi:ComF family protein [Halothiobacillus sp. DCM-1]|uniref:ComF family protein n=1 Tax=Halothiobacillus sp. DCM-1 TaxID=3112558 RepID=UPI003247EE5D